MDTWMKVVWAAAAVAVIASLVALAGSSGGRSAPPPPTYSSTPEYFTQPDPARSTLYYGVRQNGETVIYSSGLLR